jgi:hypothetical protein
VLDELFAQLEQANGLPRGYLARTAQIESNNDPNARNPTSGASGLFQFIPSTAEAYGLSDPYDANASANAAARLAADNAKVLRQALGRGPTPAELYLAHQQGAKGASDLLMNPDAPAASLVGLRAVTGNGGGIGDVASAFSKKWLDKYGGSAPLTGASPAEAQTMGAPPSTGAPTTQAPVMQLAERIAPALRAAPIRRVDKLDLKLG